MIENFPRRLTLLGLAVTVGLAMWGPQQALASDGQGEATFDPGAYGGAPVPKRKPDLRNATITYENGQTTICFSNCSGLSKTPPKKKSSGGQSGSSSAGKGKKEKKKSGGGGKKAAKKAVKKALDYATDKSTKTPKKLGRIRNNPAAEFIVMTGDAINRFVRNARALSRYGEAAVGDDPAAAHDKMSEKLNSREKKK